MKTNNIAIKNYLHIGLIYILFLSLIECKNLPVDKQESTDVLDEDASTVVHLNNLNAECPSELWERFFTQRGAEDIWQTLQLEQDKPQFNFDELTNISLKGWSPKKQANEVLEGIIKYLYTYKRDIKGIFIDGDNKKITHLPAAIANFTSLEELAISNTCLKAMPADIGKLVNLQHLDLSNNQLQAIPADIGKLVNLQHLGLSNNQLQAIPIEICKLAKLEQLILNNNELSKIPADIDRLTKLKNLLLSHNKLEEIPNELGKLTQLKLLNLSHNKLVKLPASIIHRLLGLKEKLALNNNPWLNDSYRNLTKIDKEQIREIAYQQFPYSLLVLCMQTIESHPQLAYHEEFENNLPAELRHAKSA